MLDFTQLSTVHRTHTIWRKKYGKRKTEKEIIDLLRSTDL